MKKLPLSVEENSRLRWQIFPLPLMWCQSLTFKTKQPKSFTTGRGSFYFFCQVAWGNLIFTFVFMQCCQLWGLRFFTKMMVTLIIWPLFKYRMTHLHVTQKLEVQDLKKQTKNVKVILCWVWALEKYPCLVIDLNYRKVLIYDQLQTHFGLSTNSSHEPHTFH